MTVEFTGRSLTFSYLIVNPDRVAEHVMNMKRLTFIQSFDGHGPGDEAQAFDQAVVAGLADLEAGCEVSINEARARMGLK